MEETVIKKVFCDIIQDDYHSDATEVIFEIPELTAAMINKWISRHTKDSFKDLANSSEKNFRQFSIQ